ncbi:hypothetical protein [Arthrobacter sp. ISL-72]|uniref:hypothetical protein n=1 Tax=Arthrobacter sp. ISL-72 TaxID=2819114 RepID=UPI001BE8859A|nr:hypothetical protein [Arthrobacter sp. ISL-72]MBT2598114.1 RHS repeat protein [Arthrobacter sp. ISL-72]
MAAGSGLAPVPVLCDEGINNAGKLSAYTDGRTTATSFEYDASGRTSKITYGTGTTAQSIWTPAYPSATSTTLTDPNGKRYLQLARLPER